MGRVRLDWRVFSNSTWACRVEKFLTHYMRKNQLNLTHVSQVKLGWINGLYLNLVIYILSRIWLYPSLCMEMFVIYTQKKKKGKKEKKRKEEIVSFPRCLNWISNLPIYMSFKKACTTCAKDWAWSTGLVQDKVCSNLCCNKKRLHQFLQMSLSWCNEEKAHILFIYASKIQWEMNLPKSIPKIIRFVFGCICVLK